MNGPTRSSSFERQAPSGGVQRRGRSTDVFDELDQFVDSEPVAWPAQARWPAADEDGRLHGRGGRGRARGNDAASAGEADPEAAFSRAPAPASSRREVFAKRLDEELSKPPEARAQAKQATGKTGKETKRVEAEEFRRQEREAFARAVSEVAGGRSAAQAATGAGPPGRGEARGSRAGAGEAAARSRQEAGEEFLPRAERSDADHGEEPEDALDWEIGNAIRGIVNQRQSVREIDPERPIVSGQQAEAIEPSTAPAEAPPPVEASPTQSRKVASARAGQPAAPGGEPAPARPSSPSSSIGTKRAKPIPTFRYQRAEEPETSFPAAPPDVDDPLQSVFFSDARDAFHEAHGRGEGDEDPYLTELAQDDEEFDPDADRARAPHGEDEELPPSLSRAARRSRHRPQWRAAGIAAIVAGIAVFGVLAVVGVGVLAGGSGRQPDGEPPIIKADARDVKERPESTGSTAEPDVMEQTELTGTEVLEVPDAVRIRAEPPPEELSDADDEPVVPQVRTLVVRDDGTIVPAGRESGAGSERRNGPGSVRTVRPETTAPDGAGQREVDVAAAPGTRTMPFGFTPQEPATPDSASPAERVVREEDEQAATAPQEAEIGVEGVAPPVPRPRPEAGPNAVAAGSSQERGGPVPLSSGRQVASAPPRQDPAPAAESGGAPWGVQLSSRRSRSAAERSFQGLQDRYPSILGGLQPMIMRAEVDGRGTFYRVRIAAQSRGEAAALCQRLKSAGADCFIGRN